MRSKLISDSIFIAYGKYSLLVLFSVLMMSCNRDSEGYKTTDSGLKYKFIDQSNGDKPQSGDIMIMDISYYTPYDSTLYDSKQVRDSFSVVKVDPTFTGGVEEGFAMMSAGDSAEFKVSADSLFEKTFFTTLPPYLNKGDLIRFQVRLRKIIPKSYADSLLQARDLELRQREFELIEQFLTEQKMDVMPTKNGVYLNISKPGKGPFAEPGDSVFVLYTGRLIDGTIFDHRNDPANPLSFVLGQQAVIEGWEECMPLLNKGSVARMVIPSDLAYGNEEIGLLKPYSTLIFDVEITDIRKPVKPNP